MLCSLLAAFVPQSHVQELCTSHQFSKNKRVCSAPRASYQTGKATSETRVFLDVPLLQGSSVWLPESEWRHLRAKRIARGTRISLFNRTGTFAIGVVGNSGEVEVIETRNETPQRRRRLSVVIGLPKSPSRSDWIVEKLTELGVASVMFSRTNRVVAADPGDKRLARWERLAVSAAKQSFRTDIPTVGFYSIFEEVVQQVRESSLALVLSGGGEPLLGHQFLEDMKTTTDVLVVVGPEGGLDEAEEETLRGIGARRIGLGYSRLRVETAAIAAIAVLAQVEYNEQTIRL